MTSYKIKKAQKIIAETRGTPLSTEMRSEKAIELAAVILQEAKRIQKPYEKQMQKQLARMMQDPDGKVFTTLMTDECFRSSDNLKVADMIIYLLNEYGIPQFLPYKKRVQLRAFKWFGRLFSNSLVPLVKEMLRKETSSVILPGEPEALKMHMKSRREENVRINLNHLGEAILGEEEADRRLQVYISDLSSPEIEYISVKISTICSQINLLGWDKTLSILIDRLKQLYRAARDHKYTRQDGTQVPKFVNLDMEEYRDLHLTIEAFQRVLEDPEFHDFSAGIVLQAYLPDAFPLQKKLTEWARKRVSKGGAPIKIRIVKGANLAMEKVEASLKKWPQAPYEEKIDVDANYRRMLIYGCDPQNASAAYLGVATHNLFDIAFALLLRSENDIEKYVCFEMLEGMADPIRRVVQRLSNDMLLYCPAATREEFQNAIAYLIRRLDENTSPDNFLRYTFGLYPGSKTWKEQANFFKEGCRLINKVSVGPRRAQNRFEETFPPQLDSPFENEPDTDWTLVKNREWAEQIRTSWAQHKKEDIPLVIAGKEIVKSSHMAKGEDPSYPGKVLYRYSLASKEDLDQAILASQRKEKTWRKTTVSDRSILLAHIAQELRRNRSDLIGAMMADTGKTVHEADVEVSEAIDFAEYYRRNILEFDSLTDISWSPKGTALIAPPWNFSCSIPAGGILAALVTGNCVIFKPAPEAVLVGWYLAKIFWNAGVDKEVLQFFTCEDDPVGTQLIQDPRVSCIVLTGSTETAKLFMRIRPEIDLLAETGGKNAMIISNMSDRDLAIKDLLQSAFGHSGQKCSACSLAICVAEVYDDPHFQRQLRDAAASMPVGLPWDFSTKINPLIHVPNTTLKKGLTELEEGEEWLLMPSQDEHNPNLWSPGIKLGVKPTSFTYRNELFGPVLAVMRADNLSHAIELANGTPYGLTAGLHSLDPREHQLWQHYVEAGNCYINRGITGAIVQRQPFGGCKESSFGPGVKAGGPNYLIPFMHAEQRSISSFLEDFHEAPQALLVLLDAINRASFSENEKELWNSSISSYFFYWKHYFSQDHDPSMLLGQDNILRYVPRRRMLLRISASDSMIDVLRATAAAIVCDNQLEISGDSSRIEELKDKVDCFHQITNLKLISEDEDSLIKRVIFKDIKRIRFLSNPSHMLQIALSNISCNVIKNPVLANGRLELLHYLREVSLSIDYHRYGNLGSRENDNRGEQKCGPGCCQNEKC